MGFKADRENLRKWLLEGIEEGATHCLILKDTWDLEKGSEDFPRYVMPKDDVDKVIAKYPPGGIEVFVAMYDLSLDIEQLLMLPK